MDEEQFSESIKDLLVVPYETIGYRLSIKGKAVFENNPRRDRWPECLVGVVYPSKPPDERTTSVVVDWDVVQECKRRGYEIKGLKAKGKKPRKGIKESPSPERGVVSKEARGAVAERSKEPHGGRPRG